MHIHAHMHARMHACTGLSARDREYHDPFLQSTSYMYLIYFSSVSSPSTLQISETMNENENKMHMYTIGYSPASNFCYTALNLLNNINLITSV